MKTKTLHIEKPSQSLLDFVRNLQTDKERKKKALLSPKSLVTIHK
jgi:hypothetical protein